MYGAVPNEPTGLTVRLPFRRNSSHASRYCRRLAMPHVLGIDHIAFAAADLEVTCAFYDRLFGARTHLDHAPDGSSLVHQIAVGGALLSIHQAGNDLELVARHPTVGGADLCLRWSGSIETPRICCASTDSRSLTGRPAGAPLTGCRRCRSISAIRTATYWNSWRQMKPQSRDVSGSTDWHDFP